ncbi:2-hydroxyacid dehydrogenase [Phycisphaera mikurensis]|uniref:D-lactate dehydrogenase n=1 Tax=Phycisphaera mikurensis (strain NBRC 102666 / KCTC 22515 / FYK2301M01) TaxID=1142394 RepID=I0IIR3_PHYMF|nr:2-hydroxyacid dehydrogenase [Phycisphaera mikurensis]MBB6442699.1 D-lactate dehydrogenase [Phycisphaera mikurensis]BAM05151.1 D-lactate dehydrogenase [Phycisphaera mikurensis NBRC 102666]
MDVAIFSTRRWDREALTAAAARPENAELSLRFLEAGLSPGTASLARGCGAACVFVNDDAGAATLEELAGLGVGAVVTRSAGFNHVDLDAAGRLGIDVLRVPAYGPDGVAEHALALLMTLNRRTHRAFNRVREGNFALDGLMGFELRGKTVGVVGTGKIGAAACRIFLGLGCEVLAFDTAPAEDLQNAGVAFVPLDELWPRCDVVTLHCPLTPETHHLVSDRVLAALPDHAIVLNTSRGGLVDTAAALAALRARAIGGLGIDVYEEEAGLFFEDRTQQGLTDELLAQLVALPNVLVTGHQAFFTREAVGRIAGTTMQNLRSVEEGSAGACPNRVG